MHDPGSQGTQERAKNHPLSASRFGWGGCSFLSGALRDISDTYEVTVRRTRQTCEVVPRKNRKEECCKTSNPGVTILGMILLH